MKKLLLLSILLLSLNACATTQGIKEDPAITSGKTLLAVKENIILIRDTFGVPCQKGNVSAVTCQKIDELYKQSKPIYDAAADAGIIALSGNPGDVQSYETKRQALLSLFEEMSVLAAKNGIDGVKK